MTYNHSGWFLIRSPILSIEQAQEICTSGRPFLEHIEDPLIASVLKCAAPGFYKKCVESLAHKKSDPALEASFFNIINRMAYRSVPYSCFAGVSLGQVRERGPDEILLKDQDDYLVSTSGLTKSNRKPRAKKVAFVLNPTVRFIGHTAQFVAPLTKQVPQYRYASLSLPKELIRRIQKDPNDLPSDVIDILVEHGLLWPQSFVKESVRNQPSLSRLDQSPSQSGADDEPNVQSSNELLKPVEKGVLSIKTTQTLLKGANTLLSLFGDPELGFVGSQSLKKIEQDFQNLYHYKEVSLLELLGPSHSIGRKFVASIFEEQKVKSKLDEVLDRLLLDQQRDRQRSISLDLHQVQQIKHAVGASSDRKPIEPDSFSVIAAPVRDELGNERYYLKYLKGHQTGSHFVRYLSSDSELRSRVENMVEQETARFDGVVLAELLHQADKDPINAVTPQLGMHQACIPVSVLNACRDVLSIELSDLSVYYSEGRFRLRSKKLNREVLPVLTNLHTSRIDSNTIYQFLSEIHAQYGFYELSWKWGSLQRSFVPRVEMGGLILVPAIWRMGSKILQELRAAQDDHAAAERILKELGIPASFEYLANDSAIYVNVKEKRSFASFLHEIQGRDLIAIREFFEPSLTKSPEGRFVSDVIVPFTRTERRSSRPDEYFFSAVAKKPAAKSKTVFPPGSEWTYLKVYIESAQYPAFVVESLSPLSSKFKSNWFFLPYRDPEFHVRIRARSSSDKRLLSFIRQQFDAGNCSRFSIETYEREIERYGGLVGCELFEKYSTVDSSVSIQLQQLLMSSDLSHHQFWLMSAFCKTLYLFKSFGLTTGELQKLRNSVLKNVLPNQQQRSGKRALEQIKAYYLGAHVEKPKTFSKIEELCADSIQEQRKTISQILSAVKNGRIGVTKESYCRSLIHLSLIRLDLELDQSFEPLVIASACEVLLRGGLKPSKS